jgi:hypothetical protein
MVNRYKVIDSIFIGTINGCLMGLFLKLVESQTDLRVYTLLLNVDFVPVIGMIKWPEPIEFIFHLVISIAVSFAFSFLSDRMHSNDSLPRSWLLSFFLCSPTFILYFPLIHLANKEVPAWNNWDAFAVWTIAHLFYAWLLPILNKSIGFVKESRRN